MVLNFASSFSALAGTGAVYSSTRAIEAGLAYKDMLDSGTPKEEAAVIAGTVGTINGLVEALGDMVLGAIGAGPVLTHQIHRVHAARNRQQMFSDLAADMKGNEAVQTAPEVVGAAVQHVADKSQATNIYIDGYAFMQTMQANNISIEDVRKVAPEIAEQIENAARTGGDVVIPTGDYAVKIAPTDMGEALSMHVRTEEGQLSAAEAVQVDCVVKGMVRDAVNDPETLQQQVNEKLDEEYKEEAKKLEERYRAEFEKCPKFKKAEARMQAKYGATVATLMVKRAGIAPSELQNFAPTLVMVDAEQNQAVQGYAISSDDSVAYTQAAPKQFGEIYTGYERKPQQALAKLRKEKSGACPGVFYFVAIGPIGIAYGKQGRGKDFRGGYGLAHIYEKHPGAADKI